MALPFNLTLLPDGLQPLAKLQANFDYLYGLIGASVGTVTSVAVVGANGFSAVVLTPATTPTITLSTPVVGILAGSAGALVEVGTTAYVLGVANGGNGTDGTVRVVTAAGAVVVAAGDGFVALNKAEPSATAVTLPAVASRNGLPLRLTDWAGNAGDITITPAGGETIMGLPNAILASQGQGAGSGAAITLYPSVALSGWLIG